jgi:transcription elongation factor S-II
MDSDEMASSQRKMERKKAMKNAMEASRSDWLKDKFTGYTEQFRCGRCKERKCTYFQLQTRSADEPMTTFVTCANCGNRWKF